MFSARLPPRLEPNALSLALADARCAGAALLDLTTSNPTAVGLSYPPALVSSLASPEASHYAPDPRGLATARAAVAEAMRASGVPADADRVRLASSTSEAYGCLFKLLCDPGDEVLVPQPSYPLFEWLTALDAVVSRPYRLDCHGVWSIDRESVERARSPRTRAVLVVSPNHPTGSMLRAGDRAWLRAFASRHGLAIVADEVFADYPLAPRPDACRAVDGTPGPLAFVLGGLSKSVGLPQLKLAWMLADGPAALVEPALERLDLIGDTYLSVGTPVQIAAPALLTGGLPVRHAIAARLAENLEMLRSHVAQAPAVTLLEPEGGWSAVLRVPAVIAEEALALRLLTERGVVVHPGYFFDFSEEAYLVVSLLPRPDVFAEGVARVIAVVQECAAP